MGARCVRLRACPILGANVAVVKQLTRSNREDALVAMPDDNAAEGWATVPHEAIPREELNTLLWYATVV